MKMQNKTNTKPHRIVKGILEKNKIKNTPEHRISNYFIDIFIRKTNLLIEVNGEWWHTSPRLDKKKRKEEINGKKGLKKIGQKILFLSLKNTKYFTYGKMIHITQ